MTAHEVLQKVRQLPAISPAALQLLRLLNREDADGSGIVHCLKHDPALTARLLRLCNSAEIGLSEKIASVDQALFLLGYRRLRELALQIAVGDALGVAVPAYAIEPRTLWRHSVAAARAAELLAEQSPCGTLSADLSFTAGLLHDIGKIVLAQVMDEPTCSSIRHAIEVQGTPWSEAERQTLGTDHAEVGAALLEQWQLPDPLVHAVARHHQPCHACQPPLCAVVHLADCLAHAAGANAGWHALANRVDPDSATQWGLEESRIATLMAELAEHLITVEASLTP
jgi:putative nucleotidyltransferase with HDIG domain